MDNQAKTVILYCVLVAYVGFEMIVLLNITAKPMELTEYLTWLVPISFVNIFVVAVISYYIGKYANQ